MTLKIMLETIANVVGSSSSAAGHPLKLDVQFASSGEDGWSMLQNGGYDLALVDIHLPGISGLDMSWCYSQMLLEGDHVPREGSGATPFFSTAQPGSAVHQQTILIACTGDESTTLQQLQGYGIHDVLPKPVTTKGLRHMLHKWLPRDVSALDSGLPTLQQPAQLQRNSSGIFAGRVLLVEDCEITRVATDLVFRQLGLITCTCTSGEEAMDLLQRRDFDLLLLDIELPTMSGYALSSWYKSMCRERGRIAGYVVAVTADPEYEACGEFEIDRCLPKPLSTPCVVEMMQGYWKAAQARRSDAMQLDVM